jgi:tetratricopeptide (TPR) repeat protein
MAAAALPYLWLRRQAVGGLHMALPPALIPVFLAKVFPRVLTRYAELILLPWNLHSHRMLPHMSSLWPLALLAWTAAAAWALSRKDRRWLLCLGLFVLPFLPKLPGMLYGNFMLDHWAYPSAIGLFLLLAIGFNRAWHERARLWAPWAVSGCLALLVCWALLVRLNIELRSTDEKMYRWALHFTTSHPVVSNLGILLLETGRAEEALPYLLGVYQVDPDNLLNTNALARAYALTGRFPIARRLAQRLLVAHPEDPITLQTLRGIPSPPSIRRK